jgi:urease alpha subunit
MSKTKAASSPNIQPAVRMKISRKVFRIGSIAEGKGKTVAYAKRRFFGRFPQLVALKDHIRRAVIADILKSRPAEKGKSGK